ncbi:hypothetical protein, partial [Dyadobacter sp. BHUBP1]|uniref:hypothetical protein n=1 Tax=Dyadobacter sp. BHUBP1 TaxID=3424178 RepID=UPI003D326C9F
MANYLFYDGQPYVVNLDNTDFIRLKDSNGKYEIEFLKSERTDRVQQATYIVSWPFTNKAERDAVLKGLLHEHGTIVKLI